MIEDIEDDPSLLLETSPDGGIEGGSAPDDDGPRPPNWPKNAVPGWRPGGPIRKNGEPRSKLHTRLERAEITKVVIILLTAGAKDRTIKNVLRTTYGIGWRQMLDYKRKAQDVIAQTLARSLAEEE